MLDALENLYNRNNRQAFENGQRDGRPRPQRPGGVLTLQRVLLPLPRIEEITRRSNKDADPTQSLRLIVKSVTGGDVLVVEGDILCFTQRQVHAVCDLAWRRQEKGKPGGEVVL